MRNLQNVQVRTGSGFETVCPFPVGAIYQSTSSTSPASIYGGGWTPLTDGRFLGIILAEKMSTNSLLRKCQGITMNSKLLSNSLETSIDVAAILVKVTLFYMTILWLRIIRGMETRTTTFPRIEHVTAGIELPNILGGVLC